MKKASRSRRVKTLSGLPPTWLVGDKVRLRTIEPADVPTLQRWINTSPALAWIMPRLPYSQATEQEFAARASVDANRPSFIVQTHQGDDIGVVGIIVHGTRAELGIAIHEERYWNSGYGADAVAVMVDGAFRVYPLARIELRVYADNARAIRSYEKAGFKREGILRSYEWGHGRHRDVVMMSVLHAEWNKRR